MSIRGYEIICRNGVCKGESYEFEYDGEQKRWLLKTGKKDVSKKPSTEREVEGDAPSASALTLDIEEDVERILDKLQKATEPKNEKEKVYGEDRVFTMNDNEQLCLLSCNHAVGCEGLKGWIKSGQFRCPTCKRYINDIEWTITGITNQLKRKPPTKLPRKKDGNWMIPPAALKF